MEIKKRIEFIDFLRGVTMFLVVYQHIITFMGGETNPLTNIFTAFRMPLFFFISGYITYKSMNLDYKYYSELVAKKIRVQLIPTIIFSIIFCIVFDRNPWDEGRWFHVGEYWFTFVLFEIFVIYYSANLVLNRCKETYLWIVLILIAGMGFCCKVLGVGVDSLLYQPLHLSDISIYFQFFVVGLIARRFDDKTKRLLENNIVNTVAVVIFTCSILIILYSGLPQEYIVVQALRTVVLRWTGLFIVFSLFYRYKDFFVTKNKINLFVQHIGQRTLDIYMLHYFFIGTGSMFAHKVQNLNNIALEFFCIGTTSLMIIIMCLAISLCIRNSKFLAKYLFGYSQK
uniref:acyltransferase family protein n=1 Tax=Alistipes sp. TaxID=1872444 RepID=UPI0040573147